MDRLSIAVFLQNKDARPLWVIRIILYSYPFCYTRNNFTDKYVVGSHFIIAVIRYLDFLIDSPLGQDRD